MPVADRETGGNQRIGDLELADERQSHIALLAEHFDEEPRAIVHARDGDELQRLAMAADADKFELAVLRDLR